MLRFDVYSQSTGDDIGTLRGAYVFGQDCIPIKADMSCTNGQISCMKNSAGPAGIALMWNVGDNGTFMLPTTRLPEQGKSYALTLELARARLMQLMQKREDWGLFDYPDARKINDELAIVQKQFVTALAETDPAQISRLAELALINGVILGEKMALFHAGIFLKRKKISVMGFNRTTFGVKADIDKAGDEKYRNTIKDIADFYNIPIPWKQIEPEENKHQFSQIDSWVNEAVKKGKPIVSGPLLSFDETQLPEWLYIWEHDYETIRDMIYEHIKQVVSRYGKHVHTWNVVSGIHADNSFNLSFEQLMELTRMSCILVRKLAPQAKIMIELVTPWGEYYARNQRTIPPMMYADMAVQSGVKFDAFGVKTLLGAPSDGYFVRDLMQVSSMLDEFVGFGKALHVTGCQVPSDDGDISAGSWHAPWSQRLQAEWLQAFYRIAISKPYVESICWENLIDRPEMTVPHGGLCGGNLEPKIAYNELRNFRALLHAGSVKSRRRSSKTDPS